MTVRTLDVTHSGPHVVRGGPEPGDLPDVPIAGTWRTEPVAGEGWDWPQVAQALAGSDEDDLPLFGRFPA